MVVATQTDAHENNLDHALSDFTSVAQSDPLDFTDRFNTPLSEQEQADYSTKFKTGDSYDYDMQGWYKANPGADPKGEGVHYPDTFKKPNHPTFSDQSQYNTGDNQGGRWDTNPDNTYSFTPGATNLQYRSKEELQDYFDRIEKGNTLNFPTDGQSESKSAQDAFETAAARTRQAVRPVGGRQEGALTQVPEAIASGVAAVGAQMGKNVVEPIENIPDFINHMMRRDPREDLTKEEVGGALSTAGLMSTSMGGRGSVTATGSTTPPVLSDLDQIRNVYRTRIGESFTNNLDSLRAEGTLSADQFRSLFNSLGIDMDSQEISSQPALTRKVIQDEKPKPPPQGKISLNRMAGTADSTEQSFRINDEDSNYFGHVRASYNPDEKVITVHWAGDLSFKGAGALGPTHVRSMLRQLRAVWPEAKKIEGYRVSGARQTSDKGPGKASMDLEPK